MKWFLYIVLLGILLSGCTKKNEILIPTYQSANTEQTHSSKISLIAVNDLRKNKMVSTIYYQGEKVKQYPFDNDIKEWYKYAMQRELENQGVYSDNPFAKERLTVNIEKIDARYDKYSLAKDNMKVDLVLDLVIQISNKTIHSKIDISQTAFKAVVFDAGDFEEIITDAMNTSIKRSVAIAKSKLDTK